MDHQMAVFTPSEMGYVNAEYEPDFPWRKKKDKTPKKKQPAGEEDIQYRFGSRRNPLENMGDVYDMACKWEPLRKQLLLQWTRLTSGEVDNAGPSRKRLADLIHARYGLSRQIIENYLRNFERVLPLV